MRAGTTELNTTAKDGNIPAVIRGNGRGRDARGDVILSCRGGGLDSRFTQSRRRRGSATGSVRRSSLGFLLLFLTIFYSFRRKHGDIEGVGSSGTRGRREKLGVARI